MSSHGGDLSLSHWYKLEVLFEVLPLELDNSQKSIRIENSKLSIENSKIELKVSC